MNDRMARGLLLTTGGVIVAIGIAVVAYNVGYSQGPNHAVGPYVGPGMWHWGFGWGFGLLFPLLFFLFIFLLIRAAFWGGPRRYGRWYSYDEPERRSAELEAWHRRAHGQPTDAPGSTGSNDPGRQERVERRD